MFRFTLNTLFGLHSAPGCPEPLRFSTLPIRETAQSRRLTADRARASAQTEECLRKIFLKLFPLTERLHYNFSLTRCESGLP